MINAGMQMNTIGLHVFHVTPPQIFNALGGCMGVCDSAPRVMYTNAHLYKQIEPVVVESECARQYKLPILSIRH